MDAANARPKEQEMREIKTAETTRVGDIVAAHRLTGDCLMLLAWSTERLPSEGIAAFTERRAAKGRFRAFSWSPNAEPPPVADATWFLIAVRVDGASQAQPGVRLGLQAVGTREQMMAQLPQAMLDAPEFVAALTRTLGSQTLAAATFLRQTFAGQSARSSDDVNRFLAEFFDQAARDDGAIEIVGSLGGGAMLLQGWSDGLPSGTSELMLEGAMLVDGRFHVAEFRRSDLAPPARGILGIAAAEDAAPDTLKALYFVVAGELRRIAVLPGRLLLEQGDVGGHVRDRLAGLEGDERVLALLRQVTRTRYAGHDTLSTTTKPVAAAVDLALALSGAGIYLSGWLLDPRSLVTAVALRQTGGMMQRLDSSWTRVARPDVIAGFVRDPRFGGDLGSSDAVGFSAFLPCAATAETGRHYLELELGDDCLFLPLSIEDGDNIGARRRVLESVDLYKPSACAIIERQIGPLLRTSSPPPRRGECVASGVVDRPAETAVIVPVTGAAADIRVTLAQFGTDRLGAEEQLVIVCSAELDEAASRTISRLLDFYGIEAALVRSRERLDHCEALALGARLTSAPRLLFLAPSVFGRTAGWITALRRAGERLTKAEAVSPTILYEDFSIKFAGIDSVEPLADAPYLRTDAGCLGYSRHWLEGREPRLVLAAAIECCLVTRAAYERVGGFAGAYALPDLKGLDFFLRLRHAGAATFWTPELEVHSVDDGPASEGDYWSRVGRLADGWMLAETLRTTAALAASPIGEATYPRRSQQSA
jgi:hypothetical protein